MPNPRLRFWFERARGHSKSTDLAIMAAWALFAARTKIVGVAAACDKEQARLIRDAIDGLVRSNEWLRERLEIQNYCVRNPQTGSELTIISADAATSYGILPHFIIVDELCHWKKRDLWDSLISSAAKREHCMMVVISNAGQGRGRSWQWSVREACRTDPDWHFSRQDGPVARWITSDHLAEQRRLLPPLAYRRLWLNEWTQESAEGLDPADIEACCTVAEPSRDSWTLGPVLAGLDLGLKHDHAAWVILGLDVAASRYRLLKCQSWTPEQGGGEVDLVAVEDGILADCRAYGVETMYFDPWQAVAIGQRLNRLNVRAVPVPFSTPNLDLMATRLLYVFRNRAIDLFRDSKLIDDLLRLEIVERPQGFRLTSARDETGHCDRATALAIVLAMGWEWMASIQAEDVRGPERVSA